MNEAAEKRSAKATRQARRKARAHRVEVRLSDEEIASLDRRCAREGVTRSSVLREACLLRSCGHALPRVVRSPEVELLLAECRGIGMNVNQIARALNMRNEYRSYFKDVPSAREAVGRLEEVRGSLDRLMGKVQALREEFAYGVVGELTEREFEELREFWLGGEY